MKPLPRILGILAICALASACSTVREVEAAITEDGRPPVEQSRLDTRDVAVPDLDERREDIASLSQVDRLQRENHELGAKLRDADRLREEAVKERDRALGGEQELVRQNMDYQELLKAGAKREEKLKAQLLQAQIENIRLKQELASQRIRELSAGAGER